MPAPPDTVASPRRSPATSAGSVREFLTRVGRRRTAIVVAEGAAAGFVVASVVALVIWLARGPSAGAILLGAGLVIAGIAARVTWSASDRTRLAELVERRAFGCRNVIVTAAELIDRPRPGVRADLEARILRDAERAVARLDPARLFPARGAGLALGGGVAAWTLALALLAPRPGRSTGPIDASIEGVAITGVDVVVTPPAYAPGNRQALRDPARIDALAGSTVALAVRAVGDEVTIETIGGRSPLARDGDRVFTGQLVADADGYIAIEATASDGRPAARRLVGLTVTPDRPPRVHVTAPGRDLFLPDAGRALELAVEADDDLGLASLRLRYTKVSGAGEQFTFTDGELPLRVVRTSQLMWRAEGTLSLPALGLQPGDVVVYRGVAADRRPGATAVESDAFLVEITSPGAVASEGFAMDDEEDRYAVSQQMVILRTERLIARRASMAPDAVALESRGIAAEQRRVRAEFVFMMGGELAEEVTGAETGISELHEHAEAEAGDDILAGRLANRGRVELNLAIRSMSQAAAALVAADLDQALTDERLALDHLQRAFSRTRYILRALTERERLDLSRRLTGTLADAVRDVRPVAEVTPDSTTAALRAVLTQIAALAGRAHLDGDAALAATAIAQSALRIDPSSTALQQVAARLTAASMALTARRIDDARALLDQGATDLTAIVRATLVSAPDGARPIELDRLDGALADALRRGGRDR